MAWEKVDGWLDFMLETGDAKTTGERGKGIEIGGPVLARFTNPTVFTVRPGRVCETTWGLPVYIALVFCVFSFLAFFLVSFSGSFFF